MIHRMTLDLHKTGIAHFLCLLVVDIMLRSQRRGNYKYGCFHIEFLQQREQLGIRADISVVKGQNHRLIIILQVG